MPTEPLLRRTARRLVQAADAVSAPHGVDRYLEQIFPTWSTSEVRGRIIDVDRSAPGSVVLTISANGGWTGFRPGQHTQLSVEIDGVRHTRCYSMANAAEPTAGAARRLQLGIKAHPEGLVSRYLVANASVGTVVGLTAATGDFHLPDVRPDRVLLISGGSGITPVLSMFRTLCAEGYDRPLAFLHYATTPETMLFREEVAALAGPRPNVTLLTAFDQRPEAGVLRGMLDRSHLAAADPRWQDADAYVCGPQGLMDSVQSHYEQAKVPDRFHHEAFTLPQLLAEAGPVSGTLRFGVSGVEVANDGRPVLEQAEAAGLTPQSGCRMGICHTCVGRLRSGAVRDLRTGDLHDTPGEPVRTCVSGAAGDVEIEL